MLQRSLDGAAWGYTVTCAREAWRGCTSRDVTWRQQPPPNDWKTGSSCSEGASFPLALRRWVHADNACIYMHAHAAAAMTLLRTAGLNQRLQGWFEEGDEVEDDRT
jgi:hypothetical protein